MVRERVVFAELKSAKGRVTPDQQKWHDRLREAGAEVHVWKPANWDDLTEVLQSRTAQSAAPSGPVIAPPGVSRGELMKSLRGIPSP